MRFRVLGTVRVRTADGPTRLPASRPRRLLGALLAHAGEVVPTQRLIDMLWPSSPPRTARASLHSHVSRLRSIIERPRDDADPVLQTVGAGYRLAVDDDEIDARRFESLTRAGRRATADEPSLAVDVLDDALSLWTGPAAYADLRTVRWVRRERHRLDALRTLARGAQVDAHLALGRSADVLAGLRAAVVTNPLDEPTYERLMVALHRCGRRAEALEVYADCRAVLDQRLGVRPSARLRRLHRMILRPSTPPGRDEDRPVDHIVRLLESADADPRHALDRLERLAPEARAAGDLVTEGAARLTAAFVRCGDSDPDGPDDDAVTAALEMLGELRQEA